MSARLINISNIAPKLIVTLILGVTAAATFFSWWTVRHRISVLDQAIFADLESGSRVLGAFLSEAGQEVPNRDRGALTARATRRLDSMKVEWLSKSALAAKPPRGITKEISARVETDGEACAFIHNGDAEEVGRCFSRVPPVGPLQGWIITTQAEPTRGREVRRLIVESGATTLALVLASAIIAAVGVRYFVTLPVRRLAQVVRQVAEGDFSARLMLRQRDEVGELGREMDLMCEKLQAASRQLGAETEARIQTLEQLRHTERLSTLGRLASSIAHELGTPLNIVSARAQMIGSSGCAPAVADNARIISEQSARMTQIIRDILDFSRRHRPQNTTVELTSLARKVFSLTSVAAQKKRVRLMLDSESTMLSVQADPHRLLQVIINLVMNAIQAQPDGGTVSVRVREEERPMPDDPEGPRLRFACISVKDQGLGIPAEALPRVFEPFFTTKSAGEGTGLGLSIASGIVRDYGGSIDVESEVGRGSCFTIHLPQEAFA